jgi:hypothetical protein
MYPPVGFVDRPINPRRAGSPQSGGRMAGASSVWHGSGTLWHRPRQLPPCVPLPAVRVSSTAAVHRCTRSSAPSIPWTAVSATTLVPACPSHQGHSNRLRGPLRPLGQLPLAGIVGIYQSGPDHLLHDHNRRLPVARCCRSRWLRCLHQPHRYRLSPSLPVIRLGLCVSLR